MARDGTVVVRIIGDASSARRAFGEVGAASQTLGQRLKGLATGAALAGATTAVIAFGKGSVSAFTESRKVAAQTDAALRSTGGAAGVTASQVSKLSGQLMKLSGVEDETVQSGQNMLLTFTNIRNVAGEGNDIFTQATRAMLDLSVAMKQDTKTSAIQLGKALNDPVKGVTALGRAGVQFTAQQKEQIKTLVASGKTLDAQKIILAELNKEFGGSAKAAGAALGPGEKFNLMMGELQEKIGGFVVPALSKLADLFVSIPTPVLAVVGAIAGLATALVLAGKAVTAVKGAWAALNLSFLASPIGLVVIGLVALAAGLVVAYQRSETFRNVVDRIGRALRATGETLVAVGRFVIDLGQRFVEFLAKYTPVGIVLSNLPTILAGVRDAFGWVIDKVKALFDWLGRLPKQIDKALGPLDELLGKVGGVVGKAGGAIGKIGNLIGFDTGGVVPGPIGAGRLVFAHGGETILPTHKASFFASRMAAPSTNSTAQTQQQNVYDYRVYNVTPRDYDEFVRQQAARERLDNLVRP